MEYFDRSGRATCYLHDGEHLFLWNGTPAGYLLNGRVWSMRGKAIGYAENGWLYDQGNRPALFSAAATGGPVKPVKQVKPVKGVRQVKPIKGVRQIPPVKPVRQMGWSPMSDASFFAQ